MKRILLLMTITAFMLVGVTVFAAQEQISEKVDAQGAKEVVVRLDLSAGEFRIAPADMVEAAKAEIDYNPRRVECSVESEVTRGRCVIDMISENRRRSNMDTEDNIWDITLSTRYENSIQMDIGACEADFDFGGLPLSELTINVGAASGKIDFSEPNPIRLSEINIDAGASSLDMNSIGNANFEYFNFDGGAGSFELDFRGQYREESRISIDVGLGSTDIILPKGVPVRVETEGGNWLSSVEFHNDDLDEVDDDVYESPDFEKADTRIILELSVGLGSIDVTFK